MGPLIIPFSSNSIKPALDQYIKILDHLIKRLINKILPVKYQDTLIFRNFKTKLKYVGSLIFIIFGPIMSSNCLAKLSMYKPLRVLA